MSIVRIKWKGKKVDENLEFGVSDIFGKKLNIERLHMFEFVLLTT